MREAGVAPSTVTYCLAVTCCEAARDVQAALSIYEQACVELQAEQGDPAVLDELHNCLIRACTAALHLDEALAQIKALLRRHGAIEQATINSLTRALSSSSPSAPCSPPSTSGTQSPRTQSAACLAAGTLS